MFLKYSGLAMVVVKKDVNDNFWSGDGGGQDVRKIGLALAPVKVCENIAPGDSDGPPVKKHGLAMAVITMCMEILARRLRLSGCALSSWILRCA